MKTLIGDNLELKWAQLRKRYNCEIFYLSKEETQTLILEEHFFLSEFWA